MKVLAIQHDAADPPAAAGEIVTELGHELQIIRLDKGDAIPKFPESELLMTFGGGISLARALARPESSSTASSGTTLSGMGPSRTGELPDWVAAEQALIGQYESTGRRVLGICLGSQMIASALGATVRRNDEPEVGWHVVEPTESAPAAGDIMTSLLTDPMTVFHWHQDTFAIPEGATHCLRSAGCQHQGFALDNRVFGLQFHLEATEKTVSTFLAVSRLWRQDARFVQTEQEILSGTAKHLTAQRAVLKKLLVALTT